MEHELLPAKELAAQINEAHRQAETMAQGAVEQALQAGALLLEAKSQCGHGNWLGWIGKNLKFGERTASTYMRVVRNRKRVSDLSSIRSAAKLLTTTLQAGEEDEPKRKPRKGKKAPEPVPAKAAHGKPKQSDVKTAIETGRVMFKPLLDEIQRLRHAVKKVSGTRLCGEYLPLGEVDKGLRNVESALKYAVPHSRCCWCAMLGGLQRGCHGCGGRGWISKGLYESVTEEQRKVLFREAEMKGGGS